MQSLPLCFKELKTSFCHHFQMKILWCMNTLFLASWDYHVECFDHHLLCKLIADIITTVVMTSIFDSVKTAIIWGEGGQETN